MSNDNDNVNNLLRRIREEFGERREPEDTQPPLPPRRPPDASDEPDEPPPQEVIQPPSSNRFRPEQPPSGYVASITPPSGAAGRPPAERIAWATWVLLTLNVVMFLVANVVSWTLPACQQSDGVAYNCALFILGRKDNPFIFFRGEYWRLITATFLHGNLIHIGLNGLALYVIGQQVERLYGTVRFLLIYAVAGLAGSVASYVFNPTPSVGASGAIFGLFGAMALFYFTTRNITGAMGERQFQSMLMLIGFNLVFGFFASNVIDNWGHLGGLIGGVAAAFLLVPRFSLEQGFFARTLVRRVNPLGIVGALVLLLAVAGLALFIRPAL
ncbi:MAG: rhomboid family intramembrane serine protease [Chloroflexaceae bacterium]|nr:rhomboid family intramembrane serine protease [Chloroflexaceae bacterium]